MMTRPDLPRRVAQASAAVASLQEALQQAPDNLLARDGCIQRFEYSLEAVLRALGQVLAYESPEFTPRGSRDIVRQAVLAGYVADDAIWLEMWQARNHTVHGYIPEVAADIFQNLPRFCVELRRVADALHQRVAEWFPT